MTRRRASTRAPRVLLATLQTVAGLGAAVAGLELARTLVPSAVAEPSPQPPPPPVSDAIPARIASYELSARLDTDTHHVLGSGVIRWKNGSNAAVTDLWFHLYLNAFSHEQTLFLRSTGGRHRGHPEAWGGLSVKRLVARELGSIDLWPVATKHSPGDPDDATDIRVPLPRPISPGESLTLEVEFEAQLPRLFERTGYVDSFYLIAQWFPKLARLEQDGTFAHFPFHPQAEFYADFGDYDVAIDVPEVMVVGATGERVEERHDGDRKVVRYRARGVHDFAWTAWEGFRERGERIDGVDVRILYPPGQDLNARHALTVLRRALPDLGQRYGAYPYPSLTVVHPPSMASAAGGMEYPTFITTGAPWFAPYLSRGIETVTVHELAHQWFYGLLATNEHATPVLDEGLTTWAEGLTMSRYFGDSSALTLPGLAVSAESIRRAYAAQYGLDDVVVQPAPDFASFASIGALVYAKTGTTLRTLANVYGEDRVEGAIGDFARRHRFGHPTWDDLLDSFRRHVGPDATRQLRLALEERGWVNYVAERPRCRDVESSDSPSVQRYHCTARVIRQGSLQLPVDVVMVLDDETRVPATWNGRGLRHTFEYEGTSRVVGLVVDPSVRITLDANLLDNAASTRHGPSSHPGVQATYAAEVLLGWLGP